MSNRQSKNFLLINLTCLFFTIFSSNAFSDSIPPSVEKDADNLVSGLHEISSLYAKSGVKPSGEIFSRLSNNGTGLLTALANSDDFLSDMNGDADAYANETKGNYIAANRHYIGSEKITGVISEMTPDGSDKVSISLKTKLDSVVSGSSVILSSNADLPFIEKLQVGKSFTFYCSHGATGMDNENISVHTYLYDCVDHDTMRDKVVNEAMHNIKSSSVDKYTPASLLEYAALTVLKAEVSVGSETDAKNKKKKLNSTYHEMMVSPTSDKLRDLLPVLASNTAYIGYAYSIYK